MKESLTERNHLLDGYFEAKHIVILEGVRANDKNEDDSNFLTEDGKFRYVEKTGVSVHHYAINCIALMFLRYFAMTVWSWLT